MASPHPGDDKAEPDLPDYPPEFDADQRATAYWAGLSRGLPRHTSGWYALLNQAARHHDHIGEVLAQTTLDYQP